MDPEVIQQLLKAYMEHMNQQKQQGQQGQQAEVDLNQPIPGMFGFGF